MVEGGHVSHHEEAVGITFFRGGEVGESITVLRISLRQRLLEGGADVLHPKSPAHTTAANINSTIVFISTRFLQTYRRHAIEARGVESLKEEIPKNPLRTQTLNSPKRPITTSHVSPVSGRLPYPSPFSRREPSRIWCHPYTSETMKLSMRRASGALSLIVDL